MKTLIQIIQNFKATDPDSSEFQDNSVLHEDLPSISTATISHPDNFQAQGCADDSNV